MLKKTRASKLNYFHHRGKALSKDFGRTQLGFREITTLMTLISTFDEKISLEKSLRGKSIIDLGCGDRYIEDAVLSSGGFYSGFDISDADFERDKIPVKANSYDIVICLALIEHLANPNFFISEIKRVLKPGGLVWLSTPDIEVSKFSFWDDPTHIHPYTRKSLKIFLEMANFSSVKIYPNYRCKPKSYYSESNFNFFRARYLIPFLGTSSNIIPSFLKGKSKGLFAIAIN
jgi:2-polyprenyl-3-methyl-5-hydroxy-6-metoxy-1,4-benzoquinol methylase